MMLTAVGELSRNETKSIYYQAKIPFRLGITRLLSRLLGLLTRRWELGLFHSFRADFIQKKICLRYQGGSGVDHSTTSSINDYMPLKLRLHLEMTWLIS